MFVSRILTVAAAIVATAPAVVCAAPVPEGTTMTRQVHVQSADLNLASAAGQRTLQARVDHAISEVCDLNEVPDNFENAHCRQLAVADAKAQIAGAMARTTQYAEAKPAQAPANTASGS